MTRGLLFARELVPKLLDGRKTRTRRALPSARPRSSWQVGDLIWVRETWRELADGSIDYAADHLGAPLPTRWRSSMHMPRIHARIWLRVDAVKVEPLGAISQAEAKREGFASRAAFLDAWASFGGVSDPKWLVWALAFHRVEGPRLMVQQTLPGLV